MLYNRDARLHIEMEFQSSVSDSDGLKPVDPQCNELEKRSKVMENIQNKMYEKEKRNIQQAEDRQYLYMYQRVLITSGSSCSRRDNYPMMTTQVKRYL